MGVFDGLVGGVLSGIGSLVNSATQADINRQNIEFQRETNAQNEGLMREAWGREDNAVQRRTADLQAAGLNPVLAAGGAASSMGPVQMKAPSAGDNPEWGNVVGSAMKSMALQKSIAQTDAQTALTRAQARSANADASVKEQTVGYQVSKQQMENEYLSYTLGAREAESVSDANRAAWAANLEEVNARVAATLAGLDKDTGEGALGGVGKGSVQVQMEKARVAAQEAGADYLTQQSAALARAVIAAKLDAGFLERLGVPPMLIDTIMKVVSTVGSAVGGR